jgi:hypothetical protein
MVLRDLEAQANSGCSWISALATDSVRRSAEPCTVRVSAHWYELDRGRRGKNGKDRTAHQKN